MLLLLVFLAACSDQVDGDSNGNAISPLQEYRGAYLGGYDDSQFDALQREIEHAVRDCMNLEGFDYSFVDQRQFTVDVSELIDLSQRDAVEMWGFGITTRAYSQEEVGPNLVGHDLEASFGSVVDPNQELLESFSDAERAAYQRIIVSCRASAEEAVADSALWDAFNQSFGDDYQTFVAERLEAHPKVVDHEIEVSSCVAERGFDYRTNGEAVADLEAELVEFDLRYEPPQSGSGKGLAPGWSSEATSRLRNIQLDEIELALAVFDCGGDDATLSGIYAAAEVEIEQQFVEENRHDLDDFLERFREEDSS